GGDARPTGGAGAQVLVDRLTIGDGEFAVDVRRDERIELSAVFHFFTLSWGPTPTTCAFAALAARHCYWRLHLIAANRSYPPYPTTSPLSCARGAPPPLAVARAFALTT